MSKAKHSIGRGMRRHLQPVIGAVLAMLSPDLATPSDMNPCSLPASFLDWERLQAAMVAGNYNWAPDGCPERSLLSEAERGEEPVEALARRVASGMGGLEYVQARLVLRSPAFDSSEQWRTWIVAAEYGPRITELREQYPDFRATPYIGPLFDRRLSGSQWEEALRTAQIEDPDVQHLATPQGHPALKPAMSILGWENPDLAPMSNSVLPLDTPTDHSPVGIVGRDRGEKSQRQDHAGRPPRNPPTTPTTTAAQSAGEPVSDYHLWVAGALGLGLVGMLAVFFLRRRSG